jgi:hypothetical protein
MKEKAVKVFTIKEKAFLLSGTEEVDSFALYRSRFKDRGVEGGKGFREDGEIGLRDIAV